MRALIDNNEASKFKIMLAEEYQPSNKKKTSSHKCFAITNFKEGSLTKYETIPFFDSVPSPIENFQGRQQEM